MIQRKNFTHKGIPTESVRFDLGYTTHICSIVFFGVLYDRGDVLFDCWRVACNEGIVGADQKIEAVFQFGTWIECSYLVAPLQPLREDGVVVRTGLRWLLFVMENMSFHDLGDGKYDINCKTLVHILKWMFVSWPYAVFQWKLYQATVSFQWRAHNLFAGGGHMQWSATLWQNAFWQAVSCPSIFFAAFRVCFWWQHKGAVSRCRTDVVWSCSLRVSLFWRHETNSAVSIFLAPCFDDDSGLASFRACLF